MVIIMPRLIASVMIFGVLVIIIRRLINLMRRLIGWGSGTHHAEIDRISADLALFITRLQQLDLQAWRSDGRDLVGWMHKEADNMAKVEKEVAIAKVSGGSAAIAGGVLLAVGAVASFFTLGAAAPIAVAGLALGGAGAATSAGSDIAQLSILHMKTKDIKGRCERFQKRTEGVLEILLEVGERLMRLRNFCLKSCNRKDLVNQGTDGYKIAQLQKRGVMFGSDCVNIVELVQGAITGSVGLSVTKALWTGAGAAVNIGFGIWDVVDGAGTLQNGASHAVLIHGNADEIDNTIKEIDHALQQLLGL